MKQVFRVILAAAVMVLPGLVPAASAAAGDSLVFKMVPSAGATCLASTARGRVTISDLGPVQNMHVEVFDLPPSTEFDFFVIQVPNKPFGMSWYQGDIETNKSGQGVGDFTGVFSKETFMLAPGVAPAPKIFPDDATSNPVTPPIQMYHLGLWFGSTAAATAAGCPNTPTPFAGDHQAGIQVLNTGSFADNHGPLLNIN
jgi:hypothetical protein